LRRAATKTANRALWALTKGPSFDGELKETDMLYWALVFAVVALVAGVFGFGGVASAAAGVARILFFIFLVVFLVTLIAAVL
jgi:uncharacterized membrane protein YtjA (UPF0391 family)